MKKVEIFSAGCSICERVIKMVRSMSCAECDIKIINMQEEKSAERADELGVFTIPAVAINGRLVSCCDTRGPNPLILKAAGLGRP